MAQINITSSVSEQIQRIALGARDYSPYKSAINVDTIDTDDRSYALLERTPQETYIYAVYPNDANGDSIELFATSDEAVKAFDSTFDDWTCDDGMLKPHLQPQINEAILAFQHNPTVVQSVSEPEGYSTVYLKRLLVSNQAPHIDEEDPYVIVVRQGLGVQYNPGADAIYYVTTDDDAGRNYIQTIVANYDIASKTFSNLNEPLIVERFQSLERFKRAAAFYEFHV